MAAVTASVNAFKFESVGVLPSHSAVAGLSEHEVQRAFFQTSTGSQFQGLPQEDNNENLFDIHCIGQRNSKYMRAYRSRRAPQWDRSMCEHTRTFTPKPLGDFVVNRQLACTNKENQVSGAKSAKTPFLSISKYSDDFRPLTPAETRGARPEAASPLPAGKSPLAGTGDMMELESHEHKQFGTLPMSLAKATRVRPPKTTLGVAKTRVPPTTAYRDEFNRRLPAKRLPRCHSAPIHGRRREELPPGSVAAAASAIEGTAARIAQRRPRPASAGAVATTMVRDEDSMAHLAKRRPRPSSAGAISSTAGLEKSPQRRARPASAIERGGRARGC